jgi:hypothetical protein
MGVRVSYSTAHGHEQDSGLDFEEVESLGAMEGAGHKDAGLPGCGLVCCRWLGGGVGECGFW